jgi:hypothetical protein
VVNKQIEDKTQSDQIKTVPRVAEFNELFKWFGYMHEVCAGPDWVYKPETYIKHTVFEYIAPVNELLK